MKAEDKNNSMMKKKYWFYIDTCCEINVVKDFLMIYNSLDGSILECRLTPETAEMIRKLKSVRNMGVIPLNDMDLQNPAISRFVGSVRGKFMGDLIDADLSDGKPIQLVSRETIMEGVERGKDFKTLKISGEKAMENLFRVSVQLTDRCSLHCRVCGSACDQFLWCNSRHGGKYRELNVGKLDRLLEQLNGRNWMIIDIVGGDPFSHSCFDELMKSMKNISAKKIFHVHYLHAFERLPWMADAVDEKFSCGVLIHFPVEIEKIKKTAMELQAVDPHAEFHFLIDNADDFNRAEEITESCALRKVEFRPFFNGENLDFFRENIYIDKNDISDAAPSKKKIFANRIMNSLDFGKLIVLPDGKVKANIHGPVLGDIEKKLLREIVFKELTRGQSWRKTRGQVDPCKECLYVDLCPPLSNYNKVIGKNDLCHMSPDPH